MKFKKITSITFLLAMLFIWGCTQSGEQETKANEEIPQKEQVKSTTDQKTQSGESDEFGRKPGEAHYGHNHASDQPHSNQKAAPTPKPAAGEPDKFGRKPGDAHYGHNHE